MSKQLDELMEQYFTGYRITEQEYNEAKTKENFAQEYYKVHDPQNGVCYYHRDPHDPAELTPILLNALLEFQEKQATNQWELRSLLESQRETEKHVRTIKNIINRHYHFKYCSRFIFFNHFLSPRAVPIST